MKSVSEKLGIREGKNVAVLNPPLGYSQVQGQSALEQADIIQLFITSKSELEVFMSGHRKKLKPHCALWVTYPKASNHLGINRDRIAAFLSDYQLKAVAICAIDATWSALRFKVIP